MVAYCLLLPLSLSLEWSLSFLVPFLHTVRLTLKACDLASDWSLVVDPYVFSLVACCTMCGGGSSFVSCISGGHASDWSLATGSNVVVLVACMVACVESGVPGKVLSWRSRYNFIKRPEQAPGRLFYF